MIDELDKQIIEQLVKDGRKSSKELSQELHVDSSTIRRRVHKLIDEGAVHIVALPEISKAGYPVQAIIGLNVDPLELDNDLKVLNEIPECMFVSVTAGRFNIMIISWCRSTGEINKLIQKMLSKMKGVKVQETFVCMNIAKSIGPLS
jgi:Lrp/AsnC family transcriptional regulator, regulator for asnA, asnC and gidA